MAKTFIDIIVDHLNDIRVSLIELHETNPKSSLRHLALVIYKADPITIIGKEKILADKQFGGWTLYMDQDADISLSLLDTTVAIVRDDKGNVFLKLCSADFDATFTIKNITATDDLPF